MHETTLRQRIDLYFPLIIIVFYLAVSCASLYGPGIGAEEISEEALRLLRVLKYGNDHSFFQMKLSDTLFLPLFTNNPYNGALDLYLLVPFFALFGKTLLAVRVMMMAVSAVTIGALYYFLRRFFNVFIAIIACVVLLVQPIFIVFSKVLFSNATLNMLAVLSLLSFVNYLQSKKANHLYLLSFLLGLGLWRKIVFIWFVLAFLLLVLVLFRREVTLRMRQWLMIAFCFFIGSLPLLAMNITAGGITASRILSSVVASPVVNGIMSYDNGAIIKNIAQRMHEFKGFFGGLNFDCLSVSSAQTPPTTNYFIPLFIWSFLVIMVYFIFGKDREFKRNALFIVLMFLFIFFGLSFSLSGSRALHLYFLLPFPYIIIGLQADILCRGAGVVLRRFLSQRTAMVSAYIGITGILAVLLVPNTRIVRFLTSAEYQTFWPHCSVELRRIEPLFKTLNIQEVVVLDSRVTASNFISFFTDFETNLVLFYDMEASAQNYYLTMYPVEKYKAEIRRYLSTHRDFFLFSFPYASYAGTDKAYHDIFYSELARYSSRYTMRYDIHDTNGRTVYTISKVSIR